MVKVSVIIPVYNAAANLPRSLASLAAQTFRDFELIAVNDGSTDGSGDVLRDFIALAGFPVRVIDQQNQGAAVARNAALDLATGEYVYMMDADDTVHPRLLELAVAAAERGKADFVMFGHRESVEGVPVKEWPKIKDAKSVPVPGSPLEWFVERGELQVVWKFLFRRSSIGSTRFPTGIMLEDNVFIYEYLSHRVRGVWLDAELYDYVQTGGSVMHSTSVERRILSLNGVLRALDSRLEADRFRYLFKKVFVYSVKCLWREGRNRDQIMDMLEALFRDGIISHSDFPWRWRLRFRLRRWRRK